VLKLERIAAEEAAKPPALILRVAVGSENPCKIDAVRRAFEEVFCRRDTDDKKNQRGRVEIIVSSYDAPSGVPDQPFGDAETRQGATNRAKAAYDAACANVANGGYEPDFAVGLEGGLEKVRSSQLKSSSTPKSSKRGKKKRQSEIDEDGDGQEEEELWCMAWMAVVGKSISVESSSNVDVEAKADDDDDGDDDNSTSSSPKVKTTTTPSASAPRTKWGYAKTSSFLLPPSLADLVLHQNMELGDADDAVFQRVNSKRGEGTVGKLTDGEIDRTEYYVHALKLALIPWVQPALYDGASGGGDGGDSTTRDKADKVAVALLKS